MSARAENELILGVLSRLSVPADEAATQASALLEADLRGHPSHGLLRLPILIERIRNKVIVPGADTVFRWPGESALTVDGQRGLGPVVAHRAITELATRTKATGAAVAAIRNANHLGILAPYVERLCAEGLVTIMATTSEALVHPWHGRSALIGTNPLAVGVPNGGEPFVLDMATGVVSMGRILTLHAVSRSPWAGRWMRMAGRPPTQRRPLAVR